MTLNASGTLKNSEIMGGTIPDLSFQATIADGALQGQAQGRFENFDPAAGHQLMTGQGIPLASFPEGDYRLEIKVTDNKTQKSLTRDVNFAVTPAS